MQTATEPKAPRLGILPVSVTLVEEMFSLPEGYRITGVAYDEEHRILRFTLMSDHLPEVNEDPRSLPQLTLRVTYEQLPDAPPEYRKITTEVEAQ